MFLLQPGLALVQTVDFFTPVVDDPEQFGAIAAANALSDIYAMGGRPLTALSIAAFPEHDFPPEWAAAIVRGGQAKLREAGCALLGGHSVRDPEIKFGYAVTGLLDPERMLTNAGAHPGDALVLTKALGTGVIATALKSGGCPDDVLAAATASMTRLNAHAGALAVIHGAHAATDITGFGLVGHATALARESGVTLVFDSTALPLLPGAQELAARYRPGGLEANRRQYATQVQLAAALATTLTHLVFDPQTSGGLLLALPHESAALLRAALPEAALVGHVEAPGSTRVVID